jgi:hypothetical protein
VVVVVVLVVLVLDVVANWSDCRSEPGPNGPLALASSARGLNPAMPMPNPQPRLCPASCSRCTALDSTLAVPLYASSTLRIAWPPERLRAFPELFLWRLAFTFASPRSASSLPGRAPGLVALPRPQSLPSPPLPRAAYPNPRANSSALHFASTPAAASIAVARHRCD